MAYKRGTCYVCDEEKPVQSHHVIPVEYGGRMEGKQVPLCPMCHLTCHYEAEAYYREGEYTHLSEYFKDEAYKRATIICQYIYKAKMAFEEKNKPAQDARRTISFHCTHEELRILHAAKSAVGQTNLQRFVKGVVMSKVLDMHRKGKL